MKRHLHWKLLLVTTVPAIVVIVGLLWLAIDQLAADYFMVLMDEYMVSPTETHRAFLTAIHRYLIWGGALALVVAFALSYLMTRRVLRPLAQMAEATRELAAGNFAARVEAPGSDEVGQLGVAFNRMADSLERLERLRKTMVSDVAHELRTPLTNLRGYLEGLSDGVIAPEPETLRMLQEEVLRLVHLVEDLGQLSRAEAAHAHLDRRRFDLTEAIGQMLAVYRPQFEQKEIAVETAYDETCKQVWADRDKLLQAIRNLVENAWKYTPAGGRVRVATSRTKEGVVVLFANTGPGIPAAELPYIFERFYRAEHSRSREAGGAGIGLAIVQELIEAHGGSVGAESAEGETRLWFVLPA